MDALITLYLTFGFAVILFLDKRMNGGISMASLFVAAAAAPMWPVLLAFFAVLVAVIKPSWFTQKRW